MALNPITFTEKVVGDFLRYQLTTYAFSDRDLYEQMRSLLSLAETRQTPLLKGPYVSLSKSFAEGAVVDDLVSEGVLHPFMKNLIPFYNLYGHQEAAIRSIVSGHTTLVSTGTGSGKTECFLYPIISKCLQLRDDDAPPGITAVIVYPMNALAEDQLLRLRGLLAGTGITFGMYVGKTPETNADVKGYTLPQGASNADYHAKLDEVRANKEQAAVHPPEERISREQMRTPGQQPRILLTNVKQLELLMTRYKDAELFDDARLDFLVFDEAHTFRGANGAETACLIRRLRAFCEKSTGDTVCIATSATIADPERGPDAGKDFAARFFGVNAGTVALVGEVYQEDVWSDSRDLSKAPADPSATLQKVLDAVGAEEPSGQAVSDAFAELAETGLDAGGWERDLYDKISVQEVPYQIAMSLQKPSLLADLSNGLEKAVGRPVSEQEILSWLALGAASRREGRPLLRPVIHAFVRGVGGAVVTFPPGEDRPRLWLSADAAVSEDDGPYRLPVMTCNTCGRHYFEHWIKDFHYTDKLPGGGEAVDNRFFWPPLERAQGGSRVVMIDSVVTDEDDEEVEEPSRTSPVFMCRFCGALHPAARDRCDHCGREGEMVRLLAIQQKADNPGKLTRCLSCQRPGGRRLGGYREPARPVKAVPVSDVHVIAQNMIQNSEKRRLLVFTDNRQEAAFQAGWMKDHARRFRFRAIMYERILQSPVQLGDLTAHMEDMLEHDNELSRALIPEVWAFYRKESAPVRHIQERKHFLRIQVLRELTTGVKQRIGLEPWGRMKVKYIGLDDQDSEFVSKWASIIKTEPEILRDGIAALLDVHRRNMLLYDDEGKIFSRFWLDGDAEIQRGYMPKMPGVPKGLRLQRDQNNKKERIQQWISERGQTLARNTVISWGVPPDDCNEFLEELWKYLTDDAKILIPVPLKGARGGAVSGCHGARQIDSDRLELIDNRGIWRCDKCRRAHVRRTPNDSCIAFRCDGTLAFEDENPDDYDLMVLDEKFEAIRPREHSAQVPVHDREVLERQFKDKGNQVNTLVCTPTLELGVDIGSLDSVLLRNMPPLPSNYWQRVGRAGRRHRMAVNMTYARPYSYDQAYFVDPMKMLEGLIEPPSLNLRNEVMIDKHVHAAVLTVLHQLGRDGSPLAEADREEVKDALRTVLPPMVKWYLFDSDGRVMPDALDVSSLDTIIAKHINKIMDHVHTVFSQGWPTDAGVVVDDARLRDVVEKMAVDLKAVIRSLKKRLDWATNQLNRLDELRRSKGTLDPDEESLRSRCDRLIKRLKGTDTHHVSADGVYDDTYTFGMLATEGFLPGYGLVSGSVRGTALIPKFLPGAKDYNLPRPPAVALREYVPGNLIYANGHRFFPRHYEFEPREPLTFSVDIENEALVEVGRTDGTTTVGAHTLPAVPICNVHLPHQSLINDEEDSRFQLPVAVYGLEQNRHGEGEMFDWGRFKVSLRRGVYMRLVNVGATSMVGTGRLGYPLCLICGQSRSPLAGNRDLENFIEEHTERHNQPVDWMGFYADIVADALTFHSCTDREEAYSLAEALRIGASHVLDMEVDDLQILAIGQAGREEVDILIYDPMPGGSGLLDQVRSRWKEVVEAAHEIVSNCPSGCQRACVDCLYLFRNAFYHKHLNREKAKELFDELGDALVLQHAIPPKMPDIAQEEHGGPVNEPEAALKEMLLRAGFTEPIAQRRIELGANLSTTTDFFYEGEDDTEPGACIYLDGMSGHYHGNPQTRQRDIEIRTELRSRGYEVIEIPYGNLQDREAMTKHFARLARYLVGKDRAKAIKDNNGWFSE